MEQAFNAMKADNMTIILERRVAKQYNLKIGDTFGVDFASGARKLKIVGFFGPEPIEIDTGLWEESSHMLRPCGRLYQETSST